MQRRKENDRETYPTGSVLLIIRPLGEAGMCGGGNGVGGDGEEKLCTGRGVPELLRG